MILNLLDSHFIAVLPLLEALKEPGTWLSGGAFKGLAFVFTAVVVVFSAYLVMTQKDIVRAATALFVCLGSVAGLYLFMGAEFLAFVQVMVYVGGTTILIMFGVMLTARSPVEVRSKRNRIFSAIILISIILIPVLVLTTGVIGSSLPEWKVAGELPHSSLPPQGTRNLGDMLLTSYVAPFVIASFVLLIALVGAAYIVRQRDEGKKTVEKKVV